MSGEEGDKETVVDASTKKTADNKEEEPLIVLEEILAQNRDVQKFMSADSWIEFLKSPTEEFSSNLDFLSAVNGVFEVKYHAKSISEKIREVYRSPQKEQKYEVNLGDQGRSLLEKLHRYGKQLIRKRLEQNRAKHVLEPRCVRLAKLLDLSEKEMFAMAYITLSYGNSVSSEIGSSK